LRISIMEADGIGIPWIHSVLLC